MLIDLIDGESRKRLVIARAKAMQFGCAQGIALLNDDPAKSVASRIAFMMLRCELLYLDQQFDAAGRVYDHEIESLFEKLPSELVSFLADNCSMLAQAAINPGRIDQFYHEADVRRLLGVQLRDYGAALEATHDAAAGKYRDALSTTWTLLLDAYRSQNWRACRAAHADMARLCIGLSWPDEAAWHAVQAIDSDLLQEAGKHLIASRDANRIGTGIARLLTFSQLGVHARLAAEFLRTIADIIPDKDVDKVMLWVEPRLDLVPKNWIDAKIFESVWKLVGHLGHRISPQSALRLARKAAAHSVAQYRNVVRTHWIDAWRRLVHAVGPEYLDEFVEPVLSLVTTYKSDIDFVESINFVLDIAAQRESCRDAFRSALFPPGVGISNAILLEAASFLGWRPANVDKLNSDALEMASTLRKQVEILEPDQEPSKLLGGFGMGQKALGTQRMVVHWGGGQHLVDMMAAHLESLNEESIRQLVQSILDMIADSRNIIANRVHLTRSLEKFSLRLPSDLVESALNVLGRIARGDFKESDVGQTYQEAMNPLNNMKMNFGDPRDLRGTAILTLAKGSKIHPSWSAQLHSGMLQEFLEVDDEELRWYGVIAACEADRLSEIETTALIASSLDGSLKVRKHVLHGMAKVDTVVFDPQGLQLTARAIRRASESGDAEERAGAAKVAKILMKHDKIDIEMQKRLTDILNHLRTDVSHFVRECASDDMAFKED